MLGSSLLARGVTGMRSGKAGEAVADLEEALGLLRDDASRARAHLALGRALEALGRSDDARASFEAAVEIDPPARVGFDESLTVNTVVNLVGPAD